MTADALQKRTTTVILAAVMAVCLMVGVTLAYLHDETDKVSNKFTFINSSVTNQMTAVIQEQFDPTQALDLIPGDVVDKQVWIMNDSTADIEEWAALQVTYEALTGSAASPSAVPMTPAQIEKLLAVIEIDWNVGSNLNQFEKESGVAANANKVRYYYRTKLGKNERSTNLFSKVTIKKSASNEDIAAVMAFAPNGINITLGGAVVQYQSLSYADAKTELNTYLPNI